jgi:hypothetical protein
MAPFLLLITRGGISGVEASRDTKWNKWLPSNGRLELFSNTVTAAANVAILEDHKTKIRL